MAKTAESTNAALYDFLKVKNFEPEGVKFGKKSVVPDQATGFNFVFKDGKKQYGSAHAAIDKMETLMIFYNKSAVEDVMPAWTKFCKEIKRWSMRHGLKGFKLDSLDNLNDYMERRNYMENLNEGYYGTRNTSYSDSTPPTVKLIIKHTKNLEETDQRFRHVERIFVENENGERFLLPTKKPSVGYVYARHIAEGGNPYDERGKHIAQLAEDISKLGGFIRATRNKQFNESVDTVIFEAASKYLELRETMKKLRSSRGFRNYFENWVPTLMETGDTNALQTSFQNTSIDQRIAEALPVLSRLNIGTSNMTEDLDFTESVLDEELEPNLGGQVEKLVELLDDSAEPMPLGPDATNAIGLLQDYIRDDSLYARLRRAAKADPDNDARSIVLGWMSENVDSDDMYNEVLDQVESSESESPSDMEAPPEMPAGGGVKPEPVPPASSKNKEQPSDELELPKLPSPDEQPQKQSSVNPPLEEELNRIRKLAGYGE